MPPSLCHTYFKFVTYFVALSDGLPAFPLPASFGGRPGPGGGGAATGAGAGNTACGIGTGVGAACGFGVGGSCCGAVFGLRPRFVLAAPAAGVAFASCFSFFGDGVGNEVEDSPLTFAFDFGFFFDFLVRNCVIS